MASEVFTTLEVGTVRIRAGFRSLVPEIVAGGLIEIVFSLENNGATPFYLAVGAERSTLRPMFFSLAAFLETPNVPLADPAEGSLNFGGPAGVVAIEPGTVYQVRLLLNEFARLETLPTLLSPGQSDGLRVVCRRSLPLAAQEDEAFQMASDAPVIEGTLQIRVRRDDAALETHIVAAADHVRTATVATGERERALMKLIALRNPSTKIHLQSLAQDSDPATRMLAERGLAGLGDGF